MQFEHVVLLGGFTVIAAIIFTAVEPDQPKYTDEDRTRIEDRYYETHVDIDQQVADWQAENRLEQIQESERKEIIVHVIPQHPQG